MMRWLLFTSLVALIAGCSERGPRTLGAAVNGGETTVAIARQTNVAASVVLRGTMTKKCPVAGCWFVLHDQTGTIKVDTKNAGFVVVDVPLNTSMVVAGRVTTNGEERLIDATGVRY